MLTSTTSSSKYTTYLTDDLYITRFDSGPAYQPPITYKQALLCHTWIFVFSITTHALRRSLPLKIARDSRHNQLYFNRARLTFHVWQAPAQLLKLVDYILTVSKKKKKTELIGSMSWKLKSEEVVIDRVNRCSSNHEVVSTDLCR